MTTYNVKDKTNNKIILNKNCLIPYSNTELINFKNGKIIVVTKKSDITKFIKHTKMFNNNHKLYYGKIGNDLAEKLKRCLGINLYNYNISLKSDNVRHILKHHGDERERLRGQVKVIDNDFKLIPEIISDYDNVYISGLTNDNKPVVTFEKVINNKYFVVNYISDKRHNLEIQTFWIQKKNFSPADNAFCPIQTSETNSSTSSIYNFTTKEN